MTTETEFPAEEGAPIWETLQARLDGPEHEDVFVAPMTQLLDQIRERVDEQTWSLILDLELRAGLEVSRGAQIGLELGYERGRAAALVKAEGMPGHGASALDSRLADLLADTSSDYPDVMLALLAALRATVTMARGTPPNDWPVPRPSRRSGAMDS